MRRLALWAAASVLFVACQENEVMERNRRPINDLTFTTSWEEASDQGNTRTYINEKNQLRWNADDRISVFAATTENRPYRFNGETGDNSGTFSPVENATGTGSSLKKNYAVYPYREENAISSDGSMTVVLPATQHYVENSFGLEANTMTAVTRDAYDKFLPFKNVGGYLKIFLYGKDITVKSITLCGNNGEKLAGKATVKLDAEGLPSVTMTDEATDAITLDCGSGVAIGTTIERAVAFWVVVPPTMFAKGLTVIVTDTNGDTIKKTIDSEFVVARNVIKPVNFDCDILRERLIAFYNSTGGDQWTNNTNWCSDRPLTEWYGVSFQEDYMAAEGGGMLDCWTISLQNNNLTGDAVLSDCESTGPICLFLSDNELTSIDISNSPDIRILNCPKNLLSVLQTSGCPNLREIDVSDNELEELYFSENINLQRLYCSGNKLRSMNVSTNTRLESLDCSSNRLSALDVNDLPDLEYLSCGGNELSRLDILSNPKLRSLSCEKNKLTKLDVSVHSEIEVLSCSNNQLSKIELSDQAQLRYLYCDNNSLTSLGVSSQKELEILNCHHNLLKNLDVSASANLYQLICENNTLTNLDLSNNPKIVTLTCSDNQLTEINLSNNVVLETLWCENNLLTNLNIWPFFDSLTFFICTNNKITSMIPAEYALKWQERCHTFPYTWMYDVRYEYDGIYLYIEDKIYYRGRVKDKGVGWWYPKEPESYIHSANQSCVYQGNY